MGSLDGSDPKYVNAYAYNPAKARSLLAAAGYPNGFTLDDATIAGWAGTSGTPLAQAVAKYFAAVGVTLNLHVFPTFGDWATAVLTNPGPVIDFGGGYGDNWPMWTVYSSLIKPGSIFNRQGPGWNDKTLFALWAKGARAANPIPYWKQMTARLTTQAYFLPLVSTKALWYESKKVTGIGALGGNELDFTPK
jgi:peptide/nickel transport system substrate-binding protein